MNVRRKLGGEDRVWYIYIWGEARLSDIYFLCVDLGLILVSESLFDFGILLAECWTYRCRGSDRTLSCSITVDGEVWQQRRTRCGLAIALMCRIRIVMPG